MRRNVIVAVDPGTSKCGLAVLDTGGKVFDKTVVPLSGLLWQFGEFCRSWPAITTVVVGSGTGSRNVVSMLSAALPPGAAITTIQETNTTLAARALYESEHPRPWYMRIVPFGLITEPEGIDAYAAVVIGLKYIYSDTARTPEREP